MASTPEALVKKAVKKLLVEEGVYYIQPIGSGYGGDAGAPDILCCVLGQFLAIECKAGKGKTTALQDAHLAHIRAAGGVALVIRENNLNELKEVLWTLKTLRTMA